MFRRLNPDTSFELLPTGGLLRHAGRSILLDAGEGVAGQLPQDARRTLIAVLLSSGALRDIGGLLPLLAARSGAPHPLTVAHPLGDERVPALIEAWARGWPGLGDLHADAVSPGTELEFGPIAVTALGIARAEPRPDLPAGIASLPALAWRITAGATTVAWVRGPAPSRAVNAAIAGATLAVVEVGVTPVVGVDARWRLRPDEASRLAPTVGELWIVGDDGTLCGGDAH
jgi:hypothetical protein